jgi:predicted SnoaL-like aldol condensation-catalyzing enzyme
MSRSPLAGDYHGRDAVFRFFERIIAESDQNQTDVQDVIATDDYAVAIVATEGFRNRRAVRNPEVYVFRMQDDQAREAWYVSSEDYPVDEVWEDVQRRG